MRRCFFAHRLLDRHVGNLQPAARYEDAVQLTVDGVLVQDQVDDAVRDHDVERGVGERELFCFRLDELDVRDAHFGGSRTRLGEHRGGHVDPPSRGPDRRPFARRSGSRCRRLRWASIAGWHLDARVYFGAQHPTKATLAKAQAELNRLMVP
jgi:hypothetical protein